MEKMNKFKTFFGSDACPLEKYLYFCALFPASAVAEDHTIPYGMRETLWPIMKKDNFWYKAFDLYYDGFRHMTLGKTLWLIIAVKLFIIFFVLKLFFFPSFLNHHAEKGQEASYVMDELEKRALAPGESPPLETENN